MSISKSATLPAASSDDTVLVSSLLLGPVPVARTDLFSAPGGLYGFEECQSWALVPAGRDGLWWLQSADRDRLVFLLADPFAFFPGYEVDVPAAELVPLGATEETELLALVIVTLPAGDAAPTANLRAPLVIDPARRILRQIVLQTESVSLTDPIEL